MGGGHGGCTLLTRPTLKVSVKMMVLLRLKKSASLFRRRPGRTGGTRCEGMTIQGGIVLPDPQPEGIRRGFPEGRFSAGSRDCKGGGGEPPLHVRVREIHIVR